jgi:hypothetical protein
MFDFREHSGNHKQDIGMGLLKTSSVPTNF